LRPAIDFNFYRAIPAGASDDALHASWYMPDYGSSNVKMPRVDGAGSGKGDASEVESKEDGDVGTNDAEKDSYALVQKESTCLDSASLVDTSITDSEVSMRFRGRKKASLQAFYVR